MVDALIDSSDRDAALAAIEADGFVLMRDVVSEELRDDLRATIARLMDEQAVPHGTNSFLGTRTRRMFNLLARHPLFAALPLLEPVLAVVEGLLDDECLLSSLTAIDLQSGETSQPLHADDGSIPLPRPHPALTCTALIALTDFTEENGATRVVPGSHRRDRIPRRDDDPPTTRAVMPAGSALIYHGSTWHGGGANQTETSRMAVVVNYCAGFVRQEECQLLGVAPELVSSFEPRLQRLCGYGTYRGLLGHVDQQDPRALLHAGVETDMVWGRIGS